MEPKKKQTPEVKATIREFAEQIRGLSPTMMEIEVNLVVERLREEHGIRCKPETILAAAR